MTAITDTNFYYNPTGTGLRNPGPTQFMAATSLLASDINATNAAAPLVARGSVKPFDYFYIYFGIGSEEPDTQYWYIQQSGENYNFVQPPLPEGDFLEIANNLDDVDDTTTARANLGLGSCSLLNSDAVVFSETGSIDGCALGSISHIHELFVDNYVTASDKIYFYESATMPSPFELRHISGTKILQPGFPYVVATNTLAYSNVTGDGTVFNCICQDAIANQQSAYNEATGLFIAPLAGKYLFTVNLRLDSEILAIVNNVYINGAILGQKLIAFGENDTGYLTVSGSFLASLATNEPVTITLVGNGSGKIVDIPVNGILISIALIA